MDIPLVITTVLLISFSFVGIIHVGIHSEAKIQACTKIGMEYYYRDSTFCLDKYNKAHYAKIECKYISLFKYDCNSKLISIGDVRTIDVD